MYWCVFIVNYVRLPNPLGILTRILRYFFNDKVKFIYSEKATKFCEISTLFLSRVVPVKSKVDIAQNCVPFSEYKNFKTVYLRSLKLIRWHFIKKVGEGQLLSFNRKMLYAD